jgi:HEPN domain-containing protein
VVRGLSTRPTRIGADKFYLYKSKDFIKGSEFEIKNRNWNASAVLSVHAVISACDAVCARFLQVRHSGADHMHAVELLTSLPLNGTELDPKIKQARRVISMKNVAEYEDRLIKEDEAKEMLRDARRVVEWVERKFV